MVAPADAAATPGDVWDGFMWVTPEKYEEKRKAGFLFDGKPLPPLSPNAFVPLPPGAPPGGMLGEGIPPWLAEKRAAFGIGERMEEANAYLDNMGPNAHCNAPAPPEGCEFASPDFVEYGDSVDAAVQAHYDELHGDFEPVSTYYGEDGGSRRPMFGYEERQWPKKETIHDPYRYSMSVPLATVGDYQRLNSGEVFGMVIGEPLTPHAARMAAMDLLLRGIGEDVHRGGLLETPDRAAKAWGEWTCGYAMDPAAVIKTFEDGANGCDEMVVVTGIPFYSHCEHHLAPIFGTVTVGYLPNKRIVGLSKMPRLVEVFARRLQVQERMTNEIANAMMEHLQPLGVGVVVRARHMCMESRGIRLPGTETTTSATRGAFRDDAKVRSEFLSLARGG